MDKDQKPLLILNPTNEIVFEGPLKSLMNSFLTISNPDGIRNVQFKIKTTAPKTYFVRPNVGQLKPKESITVQITLQSYMYEREKHKFLVQAAYGKDEEGFDPNFWKDVESKNVWNFKLKSAVNMTDGEEWNPPNINISEATETVGDDGETTMMGMMDEGQEFVEGQEENNFEEENEGDNNIKFMDTDDEIKDTNPGGKPFWPFLLYFISCLMLAVAFLSGLYYKMIQ